MAPEFRPVNARASPPKNDSLNGYPEFPRLTVINLIAVKAQPGRIIAKRKL